MSGAGAAGNATTNEGTTMRRIGLLGGMSWESTAVYYKLLNEGVQRRLGGLHSADLVLRSVDFAEVDELLVAGAWEALGATLAGEIRALRDAGAEIIGIACNTVHLVAEQVMAAVDVPLVHIVDAVGQAARRAGLGTVGLLGTEYTMNSTLYSDHLQQQGIEVVVPEPADRTVVHQVILDELCHGVIRAPSRERLVEVVRRLVERGAQGVVFGCTEIGMLLGPDDVDVPVLDSTRVHVEALLDAALSPRLTVLPAVPAPVADVSLPDPFESTASPRPTRQERSA